VQKILKGYSHAPEQSSLGQLSKLIGLHATNISRNNKFLSDIGLISGGMKKSATVLGKNLGRALDHKQDEDSKRYWREAVQTNEKVAGLVTTVRIRGGMSEKDFSSHILYVSGQKNTAGNKTGARCVVDMLTNAGLLAEENGNLTIATPSLDADLVADVEAPSLVAAPASPQLAAVAPAPVSPILPNLTGPTPQIAINIQLHLPETENAEVYDKLFKALRENLLESKSV
jgi:hypothetical protein